MTRQVSPAHAESLFPLAIYAVGREIEEIEQSDLTFFVHEGALYSRSQDERSAHVWDPTDGKWCEVPYPLQLPTAV